MAQGQMKEIKDVLAGEIVRPDKSWVGYNASLSAVMPLSTRRGYTVAEQLSKLGWLALVPGKEREHYTTTVVFVRFTDLNQLVKVL